MNTYIIFMEFFDTHHNIIKPYHIIVYYPSLLEHVVQLQINDIITIRTITAVCFMLDNVTHKSEIKLYRYYS